ncbi:hypothetical protein [Parafrankia sp. BMG5.11]|uniref:hypothetical protein n=2 Tax=Frankiaceae TaxID=74712 RepID=UPI000DD36F2D|nr:hypothetical protein [Parafrankia sp. BMG5.11]TCJ32035.1 hypothetical protein E0504_45075 [Parafrankia sp. BMG5.11]
MDRTNMADRGNRTDRRAGGGRRGARAGHEGRTSGGPRPLPARSLLLLALAVVIGLGLTACRAGSVSTAGSAPAPAASAGTGAETADATTASQSPEPAAPAGGAGAGGPGSLTVDITSPVDVAGHVSTAVSCQSTARRYVESSTATIEGRTVSQGVRVAGYDGPGSYPAVITVSVVAPDSGRYAIDAVPATVEITSAGGSVSFSASTSGGRTLAGSIVWACSA